MLHFAFLASVQQLLINNNLAFSESKIRTESGAVPMRVGLSASIFCTDADAKGFPLLSLSQQQFTHGLKFGWFPKP